MRRRVVACRRPVVRPHRRARRFEHPSATGAVALAGATLLLFAGATAPAGAQELDAAVAVVGAVATPVTAAPTAALAACAAATAEPGRRARPALRAAMRCAVNAERTANGLGTLRSDRRLSKAARRHARDMVRRGYFAHERPGWTLAGRLAAAGWSGAGAAEAIAWGCDGRGSALATLRAWLESPPHREIVLGNYARAGIGLALGTPTREGCGAAGTWVLDVGA
jgi:uncharacterized protein YkwD